ncbi:MAG: response regulator [Bdellovibrionales bacterium]
MKTKILLVDDLRENIVALRALVEPEGVEVFEALGADEALNLVFEHEFALALVDVHMPSMNGFELARLIRGVERSRHLPIIFVTAQDKGGNIEFEGYETGAVDLLFKPLDPHMVRSKVRVFAKLDHQSKMLQEQIRIASELREQAEAANVAKGRFLANMSHEIRTPLGAVLGFSELLASDGLSLEERQKLLATIQRNGDLLMRVIDDVLDLSKIEAQRFELTIGPFDLGEMLRDLDLTLGHRAREKGIGFRIEVEPGLAGATYRSDATRVKQVLLNVIGNAIKFTEEGEVNVHVRRGILAGDSNPEDVRIEVVVQDTGVGMGADHKQNLFQPFSQGDASTSKRFGGTGLGLVISRQLAQLLGGNVTLEHSERGEGSEFRVSFRLQEVQPRSETCARNEKMGSASAGKSRSPAPGPDARDSDLSGRRILVVDDLIDNRELMELFLQNTGAVVHTAEGGEQALKIVGQAPTHAAAATTDNGAAVVPDAILMDIQMPRMDGYATTRKLREHGYKGPIVALTAHAMQSEKSRCLESGCNMVLTKPVTRRDLLRSLSEVLD